MNDAIQSSFIDKGIHYKIQLSIQQADTFSILLFDEDQPERWEGLFNGQSINNLTTRAGNTKKVQIFYKMLQNAILGNSNEVSFTILSQRDINEIKNGSNSQSQSQSTMSQINLNEARYFILEQHTEFDRVKYPLRLICKPYSTEELKSIIRSLRSENKRLASSEQTSSQREKVQALEQQIYDLNGSIRRLADEKDQVILTLRHQIADLEEKARIRNATKNQNSVSTRSKTFRNSNSRNNSNFGLSSGSNTRNTSSTKRKTNTSMTNGGNRTGLSAKNRYQSNVRNSRFSSASSSGASSRRSSASGSRKSSAAGSRNNSGIGSARSSASNSRPSSRSSNGSFKRFDPTQWVMSHQKSGGSSRNNSRNQSPANAHRPVKRVNSSNRGITPTDAHLKRLHALVQKKYL